MNYELEVCLVEDSTQEASSEIWSSNSTGVYKNNTLYKSWDNIPFKFTSLDDFVAFITEQNSNRQISYINTTGNGNNGQVRCYMPCGL
jgi:hypothetical protein